VIPLQRPEPRTRTKCAQCRGPKKLTVPEKTLLPDLKLHLSRDPFCSNSCAQKYHGVTYEVSSSSDYNA
jgi:hypothetical protein